MQKREPTKQIWLLTYGSACKSVDNAMLAHCGLTIDECYTATWRESKYTLIRLRKEHRIRQSGFAKIMKQLQIEFEILGTGIFGFDTISYNSEARDESLRFHPGFKLIVDTLNRDPDNLEWWMLNGDIQSNRKGLLWKHIERTEPSEMTRTQLIQLVRRLSPSVKEYDGFVSANVTISPPKPSFSHTRSILFRYHHDKPTRNIMKEVSRMERKLNAREASDHKEGEIYAAWNPLMTDLHKLGFTNIDAETRVKALQTAGVLEPFHLVRHARVPDAR